MMKIKIMLCTVLLLSCGGHHVQIRLEVVGTASIFELNCTRLGGENKGVKEDLSKVYDSLPWEYVYTINGDITTDDSVKYYVSFCVLNLSSIESSLTARIYADDEIVAEATTSELNGTACVEAEVWSY